MDGWQGGHGCFNTCRRCAELGQGVSGYLAKARRAMRAGCAEKGIDATQLPRHVAPVSMWRMSDETGPKLSADEIDTKLTEARKAGRPRDLTHEQEDAFTLAYLNGELPLKVVAAERGINYWTARRVVRRSQERARARARGQK